MIRFCKIGDESSSINGIIQDEPLEYQGIGNGIFILRTQMEQDRKYIEECRQQILDNHEIVEKIHLDLRNSKTTRFAIPFIHNETDQLFNEIELLMRVSNTMKTDYSNYLIRQLLEIVTK